MDNEVLKALRTRRSVRAYKPDQITDEERASVQAEATRRYNEQIGYFTAFVDKEGLTPDQIQAAAEKYMELACEALKVPLREVQKWLPIVAAAESAREQPPKNRELLLHWASVVDIE